MEMLGASRFRFEAFSQEFEQIESSKLAYMLVHSFHNFLNSVLAFIEDQQLLSDAEVKTLFDKLEDTKSKTPSLHPKDSAKMEEFGQTDGFFALFESLMAQVVQKLVPLGFELEAASLQEYFAFYQETQDRVKKRLSAELNKQSRLFEEMCDLTVDSFFQNHALPSDDRDLLELFKKRKKIAEQSRADARLARILEDLPETTVFTGEGRTVYDIVRHQQKALRLNLGIMLEEEPDDDSSDEDDLMKTMQKFISNTESEALAAAMQVDSALLHGQEREAVFSNIQRLFITIRSSIGNSLALLTES